MRRASPLVSFNHVIDPHFVTFSSSLYTTISNPKPNPNPNRNPMTIIDPQIVTVQICPADPPPLRILSCADYNYDSTSIRRPFDCLSKVIKFTVT